MAPILPILNEDRCDNLVSAPSMKSLLSPNGRMTRRAFWFASLAFWAAYFVSLWAVTSAVHWLLDVAVAERACHAVELLFATVAVMFFWLIGTRRLHDRGASGARWLWLLIPVIGPLALFYMMALRRGTPDPNRFGPDPARPRLGYLVIR